MAIPNGPGLLEQLTAGQRNIFNQVGGKLFSGIMGNVDPVQEVARQEIQERKIKPKLKPTARDVAKLAGVNSLGFLYVGNKIDALSKKDNSKKDNTDDTSSKDDLKKTFLGNLLGNLSAEALGTLVPTLSKVVTSPVGGIVASGAALAAGILWTVADGIAGSKNYKKWGVSKFNAGLASAFFGTGKGLRGAVSGAGKGALLGAGIGGLIGTFLLSPGVGTAVGAAIGAGIGSLVFGITHAIGGERAAKFFHKTGESIVNGGKLIKDMAISFGKWVGTLGTQAITWLNKGVSFLEPKLQDLNTFLSNGANAINNALNTFFSNLGKNVSQAFKRLFENPDGSPTWLAGAITSIKEGLSSIGEGLKQGFNNLGTFILGEDGWTSIKETIIQNLFGPIKRAFEGLGDWFASIFGFGKNNQIATPNTSIQSINTAEDRQKWLDSFQKTQAYQDRLKTMATSQKGAIDFQNWLNDQYEKSKQKVKDGVFTLERSLQKGSLFRGNAPGISFDNQDDLYLFASTNPARDALVSAVDRLSTLIENLAQSIAEYKPVIEHNNAVIQNTNIPMKDLLALPTR